MDALLELYKELNILGLKKEASTVSNLIVKFSRPKDCIQYVGEEPVEVECEPGRPVEFTDIDEVVGDNVNIELVGKNIYRSDQLDEKELRWVLKNNDEIKKVIRFSGEEGGMSRDKEKQIVESYNREFEFINVHDFSLSSDKINSGKDRSCGYVANLSEILPKLRGGGVLIHCQHGRDRTGMVLGAHLVHNEGMSPAEAWKIVSTMRVSDRTTQPDYWKDHACRVPGQTAYLAAFYPIEDWCREQLTEDERETCRACQNQDFLRGATVDSCGKRIYPERGQQSE
mgnify:CR=1 FL=1|tara:strand:- start:9082 stop:9933 length:852 start_codon:yes stop_codon:yes gene_type:complete